LFAAIPSSNKVAPANRSRYKGCVLLGSKVLTTMAKGSEQGDNIDGKQSVKPDDGQQFAQDLLAGDRLGKCPLRYQ
jgi:hypothetical protein